MSKLPRMVDAFSFDKPPTMAMDWASVSRASEPRMAVDRSSSVRRIDPDSGHLHVSRTPLSKANVCGYRGSEIPRWKDLGLDATRVYQLYRDPKELAAAADTCNGKPLLIVHKASNADDHPHRETAGSVNNVSWAAPYLVGGLDVWTAEAIDGIESGERQELSPGYAYDPDMTPGRAPDGTRYDGVMRNIRFNHVSLVPEGRTGRDVYVHDEAPKFMQQKVTTMPSSSYRIALDAAPQDGRWLNDPDAVKTVLQFLLSRLPPDQLAELDEHLTEGTTPQATDHRLPEGEFKRKLLDYSPRNRRSMVGAMPGCAPVPVMTNAERDAIHAKLFPNAGRLK